MDNPGHESHRTESQKSLTAAASFALYWWNKALEGFTLPHVSQCLASAICSNRVPGKGLADL